MVHAVFLLLFMLLAAPLAALHSAGGARPACWRSSPGTWRRSTSSSALLRSSRGDAAVLLATFGLTVFRDLTEGIVVGCAIGAILVIHRMSQTAGIEAGTPLVAADRADTAEPRTPYEPAARGDSDVVVYRLTGAFFFGTASMVGAVLDRIGDRHKAFVLDFAAVPFVDSTAANVIASLARSTARHKVRLYLTGASPAVRRALLVAGVTPAARALSRERSTRRCSEARAV